MSIWDNVERTLKIAGIIGGLAAAATLYVQFKDFNKRESDKKIEEWQNTFVYKLIQENRIPILFSRLREKYRDQAHNFSFPIPAEQLNDDHLRLALIRLIQSQVIIEPKNETYTVKSYADPIDNFAFLTKATNENSSQMATHLHISAQALQKNKSAMTIPQLQQQVANLGGDKNFLKDNMAVLVQQLITQGNLKMLEDGRVIFFENPLQVITTVTPPVEIGPILKTINPGMMQFVMSTARDYDVTLCYSQKNPDDPPAGSVLDRLSKINLIRITEETGAKNAQGKPCASAKRMQATDLFGVLQDYYYSYLAVLMK